MHVGLVVYGSLDELSGGFRYDRKLRAHLERAGDRVDVVALPWRSYGRGLLDGVDPRVLDRLDRPYDVLLQDELCHPSLWRHNDRLEQPDTIVSLVHLLRDGPQSGRARPLYRSIERRYLASVDGVVATSRDTERRVDALVDRPSVVAPPAGRHEGPAVDPEAVTAQAERDPLSIVFVGSVVPRKGLHTLVDALAQVDVDHRLTVIGNQDAAPRYVERTLERIDDRGLGDTVEICGPVDDDRLERELAHAHVLAVPSRYESVGMVYLEAMEYGVVPIATTVGGASEFVTHGRDGLLVPPENPTRLADQVSTLGTDRDRLAALGCGALETARHRIDWETSMGHIRAFLESLRRDVDEHTLSPAARNCTGDDPLEHHP